MIGSPGYENTFACNAHAPPHGRCDDMTNDLKLVTIVVAGESRDKLLAVHDGQP